MRPVAQLESVGHICQRQKRVAGIICLAFQGRWLRRLHGYCCLRAWLTSVWSKYVRERVAHVRLSPKRLGCTSLVLPKALKATFFLAEFLRSVAATAVCSGAPAKRCSKVWWAQRLCCNTWQLAGCPVILEVIRQQWCRLQYSICLQWRYRLVVNVCFAVCVAHVMLLCPLVPAWATRLGLELWNLQFDPLRLMPLTAPRHNTRQLPLLD